MKLFLKVYWFITALLLIDHFLFGKFGISLAGYGTDQLFFWSWFLLTIVAIMGNITKKIVWVSVLICGFLGIVLFIPLLFSIGVILPFAFGANICEYKINDEYRIQTERKFMLAVPRDHLIKNFGPFEKDLGIPIEVEIDGSGFETDTTLAADTTDTTFSYTRDYKTELCTVKSARVLSTSPTIRIELILENWKETLTFEN